MRSPKTPAHGGIHAAKGPHRIFPATGQQPTSQPLEHDGGQRSKEEGRPGRWPLSIQQRRGQQTPGLAPYPSPTPLTPKSAGRQPATGGRWTPLPLGGALCHFDEGLPPPCPASWPAGPHSAAVSLTGTPLEEGALRPTQAERRREQGGHPPLHPASRLGAFKREETHLLHAACAALSGESRWDWRDPEAEGVEATSDRPEHAALPRRARPNVLCTTAESPCCAPETSTILRVNHPSVKNET